MRKTNKTKEELVRELLEMRQKVAELERSAIERKQVEAILQQTEKKYRNIYENATEGIFQIAPDGRFISANPSLARIHGYSSPEELINSVTDMPHQLYVDAGASSKLMYLLYKQGVVQNFEAQMYRKDMSLHWISINVRFVRDEEGKVLYHEGTMEDITKRKMAEEALGESEERYKTAIEHSNDGIAIIQGDKNQYVNRRFVEMFGYDKPEDVIGKSVTLVVHPDDFEKVVSINKRRQRGEPVPSRYEFKGITKAGEAMYVEVSATNIIYRGTHVYLVYLRDITERKHAEEALRTERNRFQVLLENAPFGINMIDKNGAFKYINPKFKEVFGYDFKDIPNGREWFRKAFPDPEYRAIAISTYREDIKNAEPGEKIPRTFTVNCKDNTKKIVNFMPVRLATGELIIAIDDITERVKAHEALMKSHKELELLNRAKTRAVNHISHELKTPLAVIQGNIRLLKHKLQSMSIGNNFQGLIEALERNLERLFNISEETDEIFRVSQELETSVILNDLDRLWQRMEDLSDIPPDIRVHWDALKGWMNQYFSGSSRAFQSIDLYPFIKQVAEKVRQSAHHRNIRFQVEGENDIFIFMDPVILREVSEGLLKNAIENTPDGGLIRIMVEQKDDRIWLHVTDFGVGITEENQQYLFDGLFHTKETELYTSKRPYDFGAGGKGLELLRMKVYGQRFGFDISMKSKRCVYIPTDQDVCPGNISLCPYCKTISDCINSGGSTFSVSFPVRKNPHLAHD
jgi:PAS domain S-box-containing protein